MSDKEPQKRLYEGPARLESQDVDMRSINKDRIFLGKKTQADILTETYGEQGTGWDFETAAYDAENHIYKELHGVEFNLSKQAMRNWLALKIGRQGYRLDDGTQAAGLQGTVAPVPRADIVVYPDGDVHAVKTKEKEI